jgi:hypothetical protein
MAKKKKIVRRAWTATEVRELKSLAKRRSGVARIAKALKRTIAATTFGARPTAQPIEQLKTGSLEKCRRTPKISAYRGRPEVNGRRSKRRF